MNPNYVQRLRVKFRKFGPARWIGHLDVNRTWERALNRAGIPMAYTQGFNRRPRMQFAVALPLGYTSDCEYVDLWLESELADEQALAQLRERMAPGIEVTEVQTVNLRQPALPTLPTKATFTARLNHVEIDAETVRERVVEFMQADEVLVEKKAKKNRGKKYNLRPRVLEIAVKDEQPVVLDLILSAEEGKAGRPGDVLTAMGIEPRDAYIHRVDLALREV